MWRCVIVLASCRPAPVAPPVSEPPLFTIRQASFGPLSAQTPATLGGLRHALPTYDVTVQNRDGLEYRVSRGTTRLFDVIPDHRAHILNIHVVSPKIDIEGSPWRVGATFHDPEHVDACECWAEQTVCFKAGANVAIGLATTCREGSVGTVAARRALAGTPIRTTIWSPVPIVAGGR